MWVGACVVLHRVGRDGHFDKVAFEKRPEENEGGSEHADIQENHSGRKNRMCKCPEAKE